MKKIILIGTLAFTVFVCVIWFSNDTKAIYLKVFKKTGAVVHYDNQHRLDGVAELYDTGILTKKLTYVNGSIEGWEINYYPDGQIKSKIFFKNNSANGAEYTYYQNGKLNYTASQKNGKRYGGMYWYLSNGLLDSYTVFDITGKPFYQVDYDAFGRPKKRQGPLICPNFYSEDTQTKQLVLFNSLVPYSNVEDLYVTCAIPADCRIKVTLKINDVVFSDLPVTGNDVFVPRVFIKSGTYKIFAYGELFDNSDTLIDRITAESIVVKK